MNFDQLVEFLAILQTNCVPTESLDIPTQAKFAIFECTFLALLVLLNFQCFGNTSATANIFLLGILKCWQTESVFIEKTVALIFLTTLDLVGELFQQDPVRAQN